MMRALSELMRVLNLLLFILIVVGLFFLFEGSPSVYEAMRQATVAHFTGVTK